MKINQLIKCAVLLASITLVGCSFSLKDTLANSIDNTQFNTLTIERTGCYGSCPTYKITVFSNGKINYEGYKFVKVTGKIQSIMTKKRSQLIKEAIIKVNLFSLKDRYDGQNDCDSFSKDQSSTIITVTNNIKKKKIHHYLGCYEQDGIVFPRQLTLFENKVDEIVNSFKWTGYQ